jgi:hypothetical protein
MMQARAAWGARAVALASGTALIVLALSMDRVWFDAHVLPVWGQARASQATTVSVLRVALALVGFVLLAFVPLLPRLLRRCAPGRLLSQSALCLAAALLGTVAAESILRTRTWYSLFGNFGTVEPLRQTDAELGWVYVPNHVGHNIVGGRDVDYATDGNGYRVRASGATTDTRRPAVIFIGESVMQGWGLQWQETIPAQAERMLGVASANLAVNGYGTDQIYLRLKRELPRFERTVAVVILFMPALVDRDLDHDRPYLDAELRWHAGNTPRLRLVAQAERVLRIRSRARIAAGVATTQAALKGMFALAQRRKAEALIVVPQFGPAEPAEVALRRRVLDEAGLPYVLVPLDRRWLLPGDHHPDARGAKAIADAVARRLSPHLVRAAQPAD